jgi:ABC-type sugar transport system permease subunit
VIQKRTTKWFFLFPALLIYTVFRVLPIFASLVLSVFEWNGLGDAVFVGLRNFKELFVDRYFYYALRNNLKLMVFFVAGTVIVGLLLAYFVDTIGRGKGAFRIMLFMPVLLSNLVTGLIWKWALNPSYGLLNDGLKAIGMEHLIQNWLGNGDILVWIIIIMSVWKSYGRVFVMILAGIQGIPEEISEAAYIDGAKEWQRLWYITIPMLKPIMAVVITLTLINAFRSFDIFYIMTNQAVVETAYVLSTYLYKSGMNYMQFGYASAIAVIQLILVMAVAILYFRTFTNEKVRKTR